MKNNNNNDNKSLFLYTSLIFIVAILLIIIAFFGQTNVQKNQPEIAVEETTQPAAQNSGISERASVLSEENRILLEEKTDLENTIQEQDETIESLKSENTALNKKIKTNDLLLQANGYIIEGNKEKASECINAVSYESLSADQKIIYDNILTKLK